MTAKLNIVQGDVFGRWTVLNEAERIHNRRWNCLCACGVVKVVPQGHLVGGKSKSCGCRQKDTSGLVTGAQARARAYQLEEDRIANNRKMCNVCNTEKPLSEFWTKKYANAGKSFCCKECGRADNQERYKPKPKGSRRPDVVGQVHNQLTIIKDAPDRNKRRYVLCSCSCGGSIEVLLINVRNGNTKSCGCLQKITGPLNLKRKSQ